MPFWYYDKEELKNTPSARDGISHETESRYRTEGARFIIDAGTKMDLGYNTMATGVVYFHRFYMFHSFKEYPRYVTASSCLFLAGKVEETPKKCKDIIKTAKTLLSEQKFTTFGEDPREELMTLERVLLQTIKFDLQVNHPYKYLLRYAKFLKGDKAKLQNLIQMAWTFVNDSLSTTLCLQWEPEIIAVALIYLAGRLSRFEVMDLNGKQWWNMFIEDITMEILEDICLQALDLYPQANTKLFESPSNSSNGTTESPVVSTSNTLNVSVPDVNERPLVEENTMETPYAMNFPNNFIYYPPIDVSVPPPNMVTIPCIQQTNIQPQYQPYSYPPNLPYIPPTPRYNQPYYRPKL